jgi:hypothetical protein
LKLVTVNGSIGLHEAGALNAGEHPMHTPRPPRPMRAREPAPPEAPTPTPKP